MRRRPISPVDYLELYALVGELWLWRDRLVWTQAELERYLDSPDVHVWSAHVRGATAGYFELRQHADRSVELMYFGLAPSFMGRGIGGWLLTRAAHEAFALGAPELSGARLHDRERGSVSARRPGEDRTGDAKRHGAGDDARLTVICAHPRSGAPAALPPPPPPTASRSSPAPARPPRAATRVVSSAVASRLALVPTWPLPAPAIAQPALRFRPEPLAALAS